MYTLIESWKGHIETVCVSNDPEVINGWRDQLDAEHSIERDEKGFVEVGGEWEVEIHNVEQYKITLTIDNVIPTN